MDGGAHSFLLPDHNGVLLVPSASFLWMMSGSGSVQLFMPVSCCSNPAFVLLTCFGLLLQSGLRSTGLLVLCDASISHTVCPSSIALGRSPVIIPLQLGEDPWYIFGKQDIYSFGLCFFGLSLKPSNHSCEFFCVAISRASVVDITFYFSSIQDRSLMVPLCTSFSWPMPLWASLILTYRLFLHWGHSLHIVLLIFYPRILLQYVSQFFLLALAL